MTYRLSRLLHRRMCISVVMATLMAGFTYGGSVSASDKEHSFVLRARRVLPVSPDLPWVIEPGIVIVRDGRIEALGADLELPPDLPIVDMPGVTVMPGLVAAATPFAGSHTGDESIGAGYRAIDAHDPYGNYDAVLASGVTTMHLSPGMHRLVTGQGAVVKIGGPLDKRVLSGRADLSINLGESAFNPPRDVTYQTPASSDLAIQPAVRQRPESRIGQFLAIEEALGRNEPVQFATMHGAALVHAWRDEIPLRINVQRGVDLRSAAAFVRQHGRTAYVVGAAEAEVAAADLRGAGLPVVYRIAGPTRGPASDIGLDPDTLERDISTLEALDGIKLALVGADGGSIMDLRLTAATALRAGLSRRRVIEAVTRIPAEILGVADRVGRLAPGLSADLVAFSGDPLASTTHVQRVYVGGALAFEAPDTGALVVRAGTVWIDEGHRIKDGAVLIEDGKIVAVGHSVPHPPFSRVIDAGPDGFVTPGFIDAHGHLGLDGDKSASGPGLSLTKVIGVHDVTENRVARAGVTTVMLSPYAASGQGSQIAAVKTAGSDRKSRIVRDTAGILFDFRESDPMDVGSKIEKRLEAGKKYLETWEKYEKELAEWKEKQAKGEVVNGKPKSETVKEGDGDADPVTGTWSVTISGGPIPEPQTASMVLRLTGTEIEGLLSMPGQGEEVKVTATLEGMHISGQIEVDTGGMGYPLIEADIVEEDHIVGKISFQGLDIDMDATRTDKTAVEFKVVKRRTRGKGGRPLPPKLDAGLEPLRAALRKKIPLVVGVRTPAQIAEVLKVAKKFEVLVVLRGAEGALEHVSDLVERGVGVIVPQRVVRWVKDSLYHQADDLVRQGVSIAFQSQGEDSARTLSLVGLHAVERGLSADAALAALTTYPSRMFGLSDRIGGLKAGADGDLVIFNGHPFDTSTRIEHVIVNGREVQ